MVRLEFSVRFFYLFFRSAAMDGDWCTFQRDGGRFVSDFSSLVIAVLLVFVQSLIFIINLIL